MHGTLREVQVRKQASGRQGRSLERQVCLEYGVMPTECFILDSSPEFPGGKREPDHFLPAEQWVPGTVA